MAEEKISQAEKQIKTITWLLTVVIFAILYLFHEKFEKDKFFKEAFGLVAYTYPILATMIAAKEITNRNKKNGDHVIDFIDSIVLYVAATIFYGAYILFDTNSYYPLFPILGCIIAYITILKFNQDGKNSFMRFLLIPTIPTFSFIVYAWIKNL
ncbi:hypothetical protein [Limnohabitans lacus]|uniref:Tripartite tricarboxylate transporter TctB family protein n=1 Tax=Limnohabitans lacus TaxID=3045173 RepID=A0ABT6X2G5_9BURK|nr:hypothetical protein [Limnohabitans sp. HM2-2]MDI9232310.1 hypothetical protein [Limnohabitans sp. HM2-2]